MKVLHVNDYYHARGGVGQYLLSVADLLNKHGHGNIILYCKASAHTIRDSRWPAYQVDTDEEGVLTSALQRITARERPDVAYIHHVASPALVEVVAKMLPAVAYVHGFAAVCPGLAKYYRRGEQVCQRPFGPGCLPMHYLRRCSAARRPATVLRLMETTKRLRQALQRVPRLLAATPYMKRLLIQNGLVADRITILAPHFVVPGEIPSYSPPEQPDNILYAGRLEIEKGVPHLLSALRLLPEAAWLTIAGDGTQRGACERLTERLGLAGRVEFLGWVDADEVSGYYCRRSALSIMPSICPEAFGKSGVEALTQGRPVVAFAVGGIPDWLDDGRTGLLARPADSADLARKIQELLLDRSQQEMMGQRGQGVVAERYGAKHHLATLEATLHGACNV